MTSKQRLKIFINALNNSLIETLKYDHRILKAPLTLLLLLRSTLLWVMGKENQAYDAMSSIFRFGWLGSFTPITIFFTKLYEENSRYEQQRLEIHQDLIDNVEPLSNTAKFFDDPTLLFEGVVIILKPYFKNEKGVLLVKYSYYFPLLMKLFDIKQIDQHYSIVLEPSWAGYCERNILVYNDLPSKVYVMTYEDRDRKFLETLNCNLIPVDIGPNWWIDFRNFKPDATIERDIDVLMIASWGAFKRHFNFFKTIRKLKDMGCNYKVQLAGYPADLNLDDIKNLVQYFGLSENVTVHEWLPPEEVSELMRRSKVNIVWSRFEGNNRAIIEGMFSDTPCILRAGHNYGQEYDYINIKTGKFSSDKQLANTLIDMIENPAQFSPREYVMTNHTCTQATSILNNVMSQHALRDAQQWQHSLVVKINELHGMKYFHDAEREKFSEDYKRLESFIL